MKKSVLEITQIILSKMDSDEVNSIGDTVESTQVAQELETTFYEFVNGLKIPERQKLIAFEALQEPEIRPNYLKTKELVDTFEFIMYNIGTEEAPSYKKLIYKEPKEFLLCVVTSVQGSTTMVVQDFNGAFFPIKTDADPQYYTMFDDEYIVTDAFNSSVDDTLQESKAFGMAQVLPVFLMEDDYIPELPAKYFPALIAETASMCFINHKQSPNSKEEQRAHRQLVRTLNNRRRTEEAVSQKANYGRNR